MLDFGNGCPGLIRTIRNLDYLHLAFRDWVTFPELATRREHLPVPINADWMVDLHPIGVKGNKLVGSLNDVTRGAVVFDEVMRLRIVVLLETADELNVGAAEGV